MSTHTTLCDDLNVGRHHPSCLKGRHAKIGKLEAHCQDERRRKA